MMSMWLSGSCMGWRVSYLEYSSTMSCSRTWVSICSRRGSARTRTAFPLSSISSQAGGRRSPAADAHVAVAHQLTRLAAAGSPAGAEHDVVEAGFEHPQQVVTGDA